MIEWREGAILFDDLRLEKAVGAGAFGEVWRARQLSWERDVAVKRVKASDEARIRSMEQEAIHWLEIGLHPYVTTCYYTRRHEGAPVIVLEYASDGALDRWIKDGRLLFDEHATELILKFSLETAWGLACAHNTGLLHLDVKPANILIENGRAKITDFGISSRLGQDLSSSGTRAFASPEQLSREEVGEKADVFSWAVTVFALFSQEVSWTVGIAAAEALEDAWALGRIPLKMPESIYRLLLACMEEEPAARPAMEQAADEMLKILRTEYPGFDAPAKVIDRQPLTAAEYNNRAVYMYETGDLAGAGEYFRTAIETAADITVPQYNKGLADYFAGLTTPAKLLEEILNRGHGAQTDEHIVAARLFMLNGDARSIAEGPEFEEASPAAKAWIADGAPGALAIERLHTAVYMQPDDREKIRKILTGGGLGAFNKNKNAIPVDLIVSPKRKTFLLDNDKGAVLLGGLNQGATPWMTCMVFHDKLKLETAYFLGENAVLFLDGIIQVCDFSDPGNLVFSRLPGAQELQALGGAGRIADVEALDNVSCILYESVSGGYAALILDLSEGIGSALTKLVTQNEWSPALTKLPKIQKFRPDISFCADGSVLISHADETKKYMEMAVYLMNGSGAANESFRISPDEWGGKRRMADDPDKVMPSNNTSAPLSRIAGNFGTGATLVRHSAQYRNISSHEDILAFEYACTVKFAPYRFIAMAYDDTPATGGSLVLEYDGEFFISRIDKGDTPPPDRVEWLMMKAVSGAVAKDRRDVIAGVSTAYNSLLVSGDYGKISDVAEALRPLLDSGDENALALWQRVSRDFPRGNPFLAVEREAVRLDTEMEYKVSYPKPLYPGLPFSRPSAYGKVRFSYNIRQSVPPLVVTNGNAPPREFSAVGFYRMAVGAEGSDDGVFQAIVYGQEGEDGRLIIGRRGILIRVVDTRGPDCVFEICRPGIQPQEIFARWSYHTLLLFLGGEGMFAIDFDKASGPGMELPSPVIPDIITMHDVAFMGVYADELFTGENRWSICFEILPFPQRPLDDPRFAVMKNMLPKKPEERREALLRNGFGNLWAERILRGK